MLIQFRVGHQQNRIFTDHNAGRNGYCFLASPASVRDTVFFLLHIVKYLAAAILTAHHAGHEIRESLHPPALRDPAVRLPEPYGKRCDKQIPDLLWIQIPENKGIVLISRKRPVVLVVRVKDKQRIRPIQHVHGRDIHALDPRLSLSLQRVV